MGFFSRNAKQEPAAAPAETQAGRARKQIVADLAGRLHDRDRADQVRALPGGEAMIADAVRLASRHPGGGR